MSFDLENRIFWKELENYNPEIHPRFDFQIKFTKNTKKQVSSQTPKIPKKAPQKRTHPPNHHQKAASNHSKRSTKKKEKWS